MTCPVSRPSTASPISGLPGWLGSSTRARTASESCRSNSALDRIPDRFVGLCERRRVRARVPYCGGPERKTAVKHTEVITARLDQDDLSEIALRYSMEVIGPVPEGYV